MKKIYTNIKNYSINYYVYSTINTCAPVERLPGGIGDTAKQMK